MGMAVKGETEHRIVRWLCMALIFGETVEPKPEEIEAAKRLVVRADKALERIKARKIRRANRTGDQPV